MYKDLDSADANDPIVEEAMRNVEPFKAAAQKLRLTTQQICNLVEHIMDEPTKDFMISWQATINTFMLFQNGEDKDAQETIENILREYLSANQKGFKKAYAKGRIQIAISGDANDIDDYINA